MNTQRRTLLQLLACAPLAACSDRDAAPATDSGNTAISRIKPLFKRKRPPEPGDWLETHKEPGQTYQQFRAITPAPVGVWSMARNGLADGGPSLRKQCALRTTMTATHETGHMFGIRHCIAYECGMNGSNHSEERDRQPLEFCPECQPKVWWTCGLDPLERSRALEGVARKHGLEQVAAAFARQSKALSNS